MSHFYASIPQSARKTIATARGHISTGVTTRAASWSGAIEVELFNNTETGKDEFVVRQTTHHGEGVSVEIARGVVGE